MQVREELLKHEKKITIKGIGKAMLVLYLLLFFGGAYYSVLGVLGVACYLVGKFILREGAIKKKK